MYIAIAEAGSCVYKLKVLSDLLQRFISRLVIRKITFSQA